VLVSGAGDTPVSAVVQRFEHELAFRHDGILGGVIVCLCLVGLCSSFFTLPRRVRTPLFVLTSFAILGPLLGNPAYVYPRYFLHMLAFAVPCVAWFISVRVLRSSNWANAAFSAAVIGLWASTQPWRLPQFVDLRSAAIIARYEAQVLRSRFAVDTFISVAMRFYNGDPGRIVNSGHPMPDDVEHFLMSVPHSLQKIPPGFAVERRIDGMESDILLLSKVATSR
jgi:hypothetical protein